jgi:hypothetical protein
MAQGNVLLPTRAILEIQQGEAGASNWTALGLINDVSTVRLGAIDSTEATVSRAVGRDERSGKTRVIGSWLSGDVITHSSELEILDVKVRTLLETLGGRNNFRVRYFSGERAEPTNYEWMRVLSGVRLTKPKGAFSRDMVSSSDGVEAPADAQKRTFPLEADDFFEVEAIIRQNISGTVTTLAIKDVASIGYPRAAGDVTGENTNNPGNKEYVFITAKSGVGAPSKVFFTSNKGTNWSSTDTLNDFDGSGICKAGPYIVISGNDATGGGLAYATAASVKDGTATWTRSTGVAAGGRVAKVRAINDTTVIAVGNSGAVWLSTDSGRSFTSLTAVTANNLNAIAVAGDDLQWFGGASQTLVRRYKGVMSVITVTGLTGTINALAVPTGLSRGSEIYVASSDGSVRRSLNGAATTPTWTSVRDESDVTSVDAITFAGFNGEYCYIVESNASPASRIVRDHSGGFFGADCEVLGGFTSPTNASINALTAADHYTVLAVGDVSAGVGYIELIA